MAYKLGHDHQLDLYTPVLIDVSYPSLVGAQTSTNVCIICIICITLVGSQKVTSRVVIKIPPK